MHADTMQAQPTLGKLLKGQYALEQELGRGAMGVVYRGTHVTLGKPVAIKVLGQGAFASKDAQGRFEREAKTASTLVHPGVAQVFDYGIEDGLPFLVMEFVDGKELSEVIAEEGPLPPARAIAIMRQLASVLEEAHRHGVVHRDIKPQNLKLMRYTPGGQIYLKVLDFGIAKRMDDAEGRLTATGAVMGTPYYMAPEQAMGQKGIDGRADQYAAGVLLYEMLTGNVPFQSESLAGVLVGHMTQPPPELPKDVPESLRQVVQRMLKKRPDERFPDCGALDRALQACEGPCRDVPPVRHQRPASAASPAVVGTIGGNSGTGGRATLFVGLAAGAVVIAAATMGLVVLYGPKLKARQADPLTGPVALVKNGGTGGKDPSGQDPVANPGGKDPGGKDPAATPGTKGTDPGGTKGTDPGGTKGTDPGGTKAGDPGTPPKGVKHPKGVALPPDPPERPPADPRPSGANAEALTRLAEAEKHFAEGSFQQAIQVAQQANGLQETQRAYGLITLSYCSMHNLGMAKASFHKLKGVQRLAVRKRCLDKGIEPNEE